ncbi:Down syndrome cell adhesion molecule homolog [Diaphorina citri]|uniref:Down syndrome cell adhesion molecule homolog n=1 Tax=Diaphorina citri TaxID=121845 RepID=A0A3Q0J8Z1_DIACI|nr:Down syndrome cell adhesion molecule homolog [Diaphorina citri]
MVVSWQDEVGESYTIHDNSLDGKYLVLPSGELHIRDVGPEDGYKSYQCRTKHRLTGETRLSATKGRLVITEPVGAMKPKISEDSLIKRHASETTGLALLCPAQAYPVPFFR